METDNDKQNWAQKIDAITLPTDLNAYETIESRQEQQFYLNQEQYDLVLCHIIAGVGFIGLFLILASNAMQNISDNASDVFQGLGVELVMGAALFTLILKEFTTKTERKVVICGLISGVVLSLVPLWFAASWWVQLTGAIGIELFGGVIIYAFIDSMRSKFSKRQ